MNIEDGDAGYNIHSCRSYLTSNAARDVILQSLPIIYYLPTLFDQ